MRCTDSREEQAWPRTSSQWEAGALVHIATLSHELLSSTLRRQPSLSYHHQWLAPRSYLHWAAAQSFSLSLRRQIYRLDSLGALLVVRLVSVSSLMLSRACVSDNAQQAAPPQHVTLFIIFLHLCSFSSMVAYVCFSDYSALVLLSLLYKLRHIILCGWGAVSQFHANGLILKLLVPDALTVSLPDKSYLQRWLGL